MEIYINGESVSFNLENEQFLQEIVGDIEQFLQVHNHFIAQIMINGKEMDYDIARASTLPILGIQKIEVAAQSVMSKARKFIDELRTKIASLLSLHKDQIFEKKEATLHELQDLYRNIDILSNFLVVPFIYVFRDEHYMKTDMDKFSFFTKALEERLRDEKEFSQIFFSHIVPILELINRLYLQQIIHVYTMLFFYDEEYLSKSFIPDIGESVAQIRHALDNVGETTTLFQMGEDAKAVKGLEIFLILYEFVSQLVLRCSFLKLVDTENVSNIQSKIQENIKQMDKSLVQKDIITLCDTLEYEYIPNLGNLLNLLPEVSK